MGLLDDAIREHLELKRKHGAGDEVIDRQEQEAFGDEPVTPAQETPAVAEANVPAQEPVVEPGSAAPPVVEPVPRSAPEPPPAPAAPLDDHVGQPTVEFSVEEYLDEQQRAEAGASPAHAPADDVVVGDPEADVLEGTPDFLQETPEHDRLWFEQKPPRDFDFDG